MTSCLLVVPPYLASENHCLTSGKALTELEELLLESVASEQEAAKLCAAQWAARLFPLSHVPSRYVCVMAAGDAKLEVREAGSAGLRSPTSRSPGKPSLPRLHRSLAGGIDTTIKYMWKFDNVFCQMQALRSHPRQSIHQ